MFNNISNMTSNQILLEAHRHLVVPEIIIFYIAFILIFLIVGLFLINPEKSNYSKFWIIWIISVLIGALVIVWIYYSPDTMQSAANFILNLFS